MSSSSLAAIVPLFATIDAVRNLIEATLRPLANVGSIIAAFWVEATEQDLFDEIITGGALPQAQHLKQWTFASVDPRAVDNYALRMACHYGRLPVAQWLVATFSLTAADARAQNNYALRWTCSHGHLLVAQWLVATFGLEVADARAEYNEALRWACRNGYLPVAQWLVTTFDLGGADARALDNYALGQALRNEHMQIVEWLDTKFGIIEELDE